MTQYKTAMQILIKEMKQELLHLNERDATSILLMATIRLANSLLLTEEVLIKKAYSAGEMNVLLNNKSETADDYFNKTHNNESEAIAEEN
jgi:hypothetical protein